MRGSLCKANSIHIKRKKTFFLPSGAAVDLRRKKNSNFSPFFFRENRQLLRFLLTRYKTCKRKKKRKKKRGKFSGMVVKFKKKKKG